MHRQRQNAKDKRLRTVQKKKVGNFEMKDFFNYDNG